MNERIYTLAEQAGATRWNDELNGNSIDFSPEQFEKFAELIVRECAKVCSEQRDPANLNYKPSEQFAEAVKQHFGVY